MKKQILALMMGAAVLATSPAFAMEEEVGSRRPQVKSQPTLEISDERLDVNYKDALLHISVGKAFGNPVPVRYAPCYLMCTQKDDYNNCFVRTRVYEQVFQVKLQPSDKGRLNDPTVGTVEVQYRFRPKGGSEVFIQGIMIEKSYRRQRFGIEALSICLDMYRNREQLPFDTFSLNVDPLNQIAIHLFENFGFKKDPLKSDNVFLNMSRPRTLKNKYTNEGDI